MSEKVRQVLKARLRKMYVDLDELECRIANTPASAWQELSLWLRHAHWTFLADRCQLKREASALYHGYMGCTHM